MKSIGLSLAAVIVSLGFCEVLGRLGVVEGPQARMTKHVASFTQNAKPKILVLGDSFSLETPTSWSTRLRGKLEASGFEVVNLARKGSGVEEAKDALELSIASLKPRVVLFTYFTGNDITDQIRRKDTIETLRRHSFFSDAFLEVVGNMAAKRQLETISASPDFRERGGEDLLNPFLFTMREQPEFFAVNLEVEGSPAQRAFEKNASHIAQMALRAQDHGARFILAVAPTDVQVQTFNHNLYRRLGVNVSSRFLGKQPIQERLATFCAEHELRCLDLFDSFEKRSAQPLYLPNDFHWNVDGNSVALEAILQFLESGSFLSPLSEFAKLLQAPSNS